jgi:hypothetical protein
MRLMSNDSVSEMAKAMVRQMALWFDASSRRAS